MALQKITGLILQSLPDNGGQNNGQTINAAGESYGVIGRVRIQGNGTSKTISAGGSGQIAWNPGAVTWASAGTKIRIGIQDVDGTTGLEDGTFDVFKELTQGTDALTGSVYRVDTMGSGTKTLSDGDLIAIVVEMTVRNGADSVQVTGTVGPTGMADGNFAFGLPYGSIDIGTLSKSSTNLLYALIKFDDGTYGAIQGVSPARFTIGSLTTINTGTNPDEICGVFVPNIKMQICGIGMFAAGIASTDAFEMILYTDPLGTPVPTVTVTADPDVVAGAATQGPHIYPITPTTLTAGVTYGVALRPTTANNINVYYGDFSAGSSGIAAFIRGVLPLQGQKYAGRQNQTGAFAEISSDNLPLILLDVCAFDDGLGGGGGPAFGNSRSRVVNPAN